MLLLYSFDLFHCLQLARCFKRAGEACRTHIHTHTHLKRTTIDSVWLNAPKSGSENRPNFHFISYFCVLSVWFFFLEMGQRCAITNSENKSSSRQMAHREHNRTDMKCVDRTRSSLYRLSLPCCRQTEKPAQSNGKAKVFFNYISNWFVQFAVLD